MVYLTIFVCALLANIKRQEKNSKPIMALVALIKKRFIPKSIYVMNWKFLKVIGSSLKKYPMVYELLNGVWQYILFTWNDITR